ncbi:MAG: hypothetical protein LBG80_10355 [Bacteroidales bacterium]|nr:hypothetical protein [Bacteroidales bacterium]
MYNYRTPDLRIVIYEKYSTKHYYRENNVGNTVIWKRPYDLWNNETINTVKRLLQEKSYS